MATCPNINLPEWKALEAAKPDLAYYLWDKYNGEVPAKELLDKTISPMGGRLLKRWV